MVDKAFGISTTANNQESSFALVTGDAQFTDVGFASNTTLPFDTTSFVPVDTNTLNTHIPAGAAAAFEAVFPAFDFNGNPRQRPGAVEAP